MSSHPARLPFLLEIGSEEIPARFIPTELDELAARFAALLGELGLAHDGLRVVATPRRLAVFSGGIAASQPDREDVVKGPPVQVAFDPDGKPTPAGLGFARKIGVDLEACDRGRDQRGEYLVAKRRIPGRPAAEVLAERLPALVLSLPFRKTMRWGDLDLEYARPLQWLVCLLGADVVPFRLGNLASGRTTRGHRTLAADGAREIPNPDRYAAILAELHVIVDPAERRRRILEEAVARLGELPEPAVLHADDELLTEIVFLCEHPTVFVGDFEPSFFELPPEVIVTALKAHQRYFVVERPGAQGLLPHFVAVRDGGAAHLAVVRAGNERVLRARLADALFYWRFDQRRRPDEHAAALAQVTWLEGFGTIADQTRRAAALAENLWTHGCGDGGPVPPELRRAAALSRFDLVTEMIKDGKEFTRLEGQIAARYAAAAGEPAAVWRALADSQRPRTSTDELPADPISSTLSVAWRLDALAGCWLAGFAPTGAKDPYALRRHALAVLRILLERRARVDLRDLFARALAPFAAMRPQDDLDAVRRELLDFVRVRLEGWLVDGVGAELAVVRAVLPVRGHDPADAVAWIDALAQFRTREDFLLLATGFKRCTNILEGATLPAEERARSVDRWREGGRGAAGEDFAPLREPAERALREAVTAAVPDILAAEAREDYVAVFRSFSAFGPPIDRFFDQVRVNAEDRELRAVRHAFLREIHALFLRFADFSLVAPEER
ncbi:MAG TPA: glycine--tRNA ligase subunit beta [Candidatus Krumholzibacteria bacterium]|nr:glycine--tRNA ligase subunit beta [Candidatus Krumholzibacteria bacterium]HPD71245.1 glycine--tRNA ligase subunit beta [Candidatus Krumholzibacteria bacterium]HRY39055.1 glycine--tRNA ligase subunit beta [Candidatus Krumholzibacteria bacterium]